MDVWETRTFADLLAAPVRNGIYKKKEFHGRGQKIINMGELFSFDFISNQEMKRIELNDKELAICLVKDGDLLFARRSLVLKGSGKCSLVVQPSEDITFESSVIRVRPNADWANSRFFYYLFRSPQGHTLISSIVTGTAVFGIRGSDLALLEVPNPPLPTQRKIASILSAYDDLIENNTRRIKILEGMAATIYRQWFVEFRFPGHENVPMVESKLGLIPQGWEANFSDYVDFKEGPGLRHWQYRDSGIPFLNIRTLVGNDIDLSKVQYLEEDEVERRYSHFLLEPFDHVVSSSGTIGRIVTIQKNHLPLMLNTSIIRMRTIPKVLGSGN